MQKSEEVVVADLTGVRTGKASPALVENINIEAYEGSSMRLKELAAITTPEMRTLVIQPWDASTIHAIEKGIQAANLGLNPSVDGKLIRISLPDLSKERRQEMVKSARKLAEDGRVSIRHVRREAIETLKTEQKAGDITEDDLKKKFQAGVSNVAALSLGAGYPTQASVPHSFINGYKNLLAVTLEVDYVFPLAEKMKAILSDPEAFAPQSESHVC